MSGSYRSGFVSIIGRPNVGKSTFLNHILGTKISIATKKPQTTRDRILGIWNAPDSQIIFLDTPGIHHTDKILNRYMVDKAVSTVNDADIVLIMIDPTDTVKSLDLIIEILSSSKNRSILALNKSDLMDDSVIDRRLEEIGSLARFIHKCPISSTTGRGIDDLLEKLKDSLPQGPRYFPEDMITDHSIRFLSGEIIREKVFTLTQKEIPYSAAVEIEEFKEDDPVVISAVIHVERPSQKGIVIGSKGKMLKEIGTQARIDIQRLVGCKVFLKLFVRVTRDWTKNPRVMKELGYK